MADLALRILEHPRLPLVLGPLFLLRAIASARTSPSSSTTLLSDSLRSPLGLVLGLLGLGANSKGLSSILQVLSSALHGGPASTLDIGQLSSKERAVRLFIGDVLGVILLRVIVRLVSKTLEDVRNSSIRSTKDFILNNIIEILKGVPVVSSMITGQYDQVEQDFEGKLKAPLGDPKSREKFTQLPLNGISENAILEKMRQFYEKESSTWQDGFVSGAVYHGGADMLKLQCESYKLYSVSNPLHAELWPSVMKFESEIIAMTANLLNGGNPRVCGTMTSGGTESILMAAKTHREWFFREYGITKPEIVAPFTAHAAIDKACEILGIKLIHVPVDPVTQSIRPKDIEARLTKDTIMIYSSAPQFPHGVIDPIEELSEIALRHGVGLHVDCCLGGFILPFGRKLQERGQGDYGIPKFDFCLPGVTSMSVDTHKYGYAPKGTSVVLYRSKDIRKYQYFAFPKWPGGLYVTPTTPGSRPGALSAGCWASMLAMGENGYLTATKKILDCAKVIREEVRKIRGIKVIGDPHAMIVAIASDDFSIYTFNDLLHKKGWHLNALQAPACIHICVTLRTVEVCSRFLDDLKACAKTLLDDPSSVDSKSGSAPIYGMASALPPGPLDDMLRVYTDVTLKP